MSCNVDESVEGLSTVEYVVLYYLGLIANSLGQGYSIMGENSTLLSCACLAWCCTADDWGSTSVIIIGPDYYLGYDLGSDSLCNTFADDWGAVPGAGDEPGVCCSSMVPMPICGQLRCLLARMAPLPRWWHRCTITASDAEHSCARIVVSGKLFTSVWSCVEHKIRALFEIEGPQSRMQNSYSHNSFLLHRYIGNWWFRYHWLASENDFFHSPSE